MARKLTKNLPPTIGHPRIRMPTTNATMPRMKFSHHNLCMRTPRISLLYYEPIALPHPPGDKGRSRDSHTKHHYKLRRSRRRALRRTPATDIGNMGLLKCTPAKNKNTDRKSTRLN